MCMHNLQDDGTSLSLKVALRRSGMATTGPSPVGGDLAIAISATGDTCDGSSELNDARVGPLASAAKLRGLHCKPQEFSVCLTAGFNICVICSLGTYAVRDEPPWTAVYFSSTVGCCAYAVWKLWSHRQQKGEHFKAFVLQEGFVYSRMLEMYTYIWISILAIVLMTIVMWTMLAFRFRGCPLPGSRVLMWVYPFFVNLPMVLALDPVTCTRTFQEAAIKKGYPGAAYFQEGFPLRLGVMAANTLGFLAAWLVLLAIGHTPLQPIAADMYPLYIVAGIHTLALFTLLPRYANMCKSREALLGERAQGGSSDRPQWGMLGALNGVVPRPESVASRTSRVLRSITPSQWSPRARLQETETMGATVDKAASGRPGRGARQGPSRGWTFITKARSARRILVERAVLPRRAGPRPSASCSNLPNLSQAQPERLGELDRAPSLLAPPGQRGRAAHRSGVEASSGSGHLLQDCWRNERSHIAVEPGVGAEASATPEGDSVPAQVDGKHARRGIPRRAVTFAAVSRSQEGLLPGQAPAPHDSGLSPTSSDAGSGAGGVGSSRPECGDPTIAQTGSDPGDINVLTAPRHGAPHRAASVVSNASSCDSNAPLFRKKPPRRMRENLWKAPASSAAAGMTENPLSSRKALMDAVGSAPSLHNVDALTLRRPPEETDLLVRLRSSLHSIASMLSVHSRLTRPLLRAFRVSVSPLAMLWVGLLATPQGARQLVTNVAASLQQLRAKWRWWAASHPDRFLLVIGFLSVSSLIWPVVEMPVTSSVASTTLLSAALLAVLLINSAVLGWLGCADHRMLLREVADGGSIGAGLLFSTSGMLRALSRGRPLAVGYPATEERLLQAAAISCRWDDAASWELEVIQRDGSTICCRIHLPLLQLYRAALAARCAGCHYVWLDTLSIPQPQPSDSAEDSRIKDVAMKRLLPTMTAVYASARLVLVVETARGRSDGADAYHCRTWTLQECVLNKATGLVRLDGTYETLGPACSRDALSGLRVSELPAGIDDLSTYRWVLWGGERAAAIDTSVEQRRAFPAFVNSRHASRASDKAVALGQIYFRVFFEHVDVATLFMMELAALLAAGHGLGRPVTIIDNTGWDDTMMCGSACSTRYLMGRPAAIESGPPALWRLERANLAFSPAGDDEDSKLPSQRAVSEGGRPASFPGADQSWWLCRLGLRGRKVNVAVMPGEVSLVNRRLTGHLHQMRTCTAAEQAMMKGCKMEAMEVFWL